MITVPNSEVWFITGSQHLYGPEVLRQVTENSRKIVEHLNGSGTLPIRLIATPVMTESAEIRRICLEANSSSNCAGVILWMHTFSPSKMWIGGLSQLKKPIAHLHTQFNRDLPWDSIDMDFMNLNQAAHGDREAGHLHTRLGLDRAVVVGHWSDEQTQKDLADWARVARGWHDLQGARFARFGDNMRQVSVTEGDKVAAEIKFGFTVDSFGIGELAAGIEGAPNSAVDEMVECYLTSYEPMAELSRGGARHESLRYAAKLECGMRAFLEAGGFKGFTTNFEDLHGLRQLPGLAVQRLMADGYGFGAEGDWKTAALLRFAKVAGEGLPGGTSFMEDYTYHLVDGEEMVLGAHMLEVCPSITDRKLRLEIHPLGIGGKQDPLRLVFDASPGPAVNASLVDLGGRFRLIVNEVESLKVPEMPRLPVARAVWKCKPDFKTAAAAWIHAGGAHHTVFSQSLRSRHFETFGDLTGIEVSSIGAKTELHAFRKELRWNEAYFKCRG
jgi:L-arabinose isomerase